MKSSSLFETLESKIISQKEKGFLFFNDDKLSYNSFFRNCKRVSSQLRNVGISKGEKVAISIKNPIDYFGLLLGLNYMESIVIPIYPEMGKEKIKVVIEKYEIQYLISDWVYEGIEISEVDIFYPIKYRVYGFEWESDPTCEDVALILFTSGTTNIPKAIMLTDKNLIANIDSISQYLNIDYNDKMLLVKSIYHSSTIVGEFLVGIYNICNIYLTSHIVMPKTIFKLIEKNRITVFFAVPTILGDMAKEGINNKYNLRSLKIINFYGAKMESDKLKLLLSELPQVDFIYSYGQTEASPRVTYIRGKDLQKRPSSSGKSIANVKVRICDEEDNEVCCGQVGEIVIDGPNVMKGYYKNSELTKHTLRNGKLHSGDLGFLDAENYLFVVGRKDNMITSAGKNIYLEEIDDVVLKYPGVREACASIYSYVNGIAKIHVNVIAEDNVNVNELYSFLKDRLEDYKLPQKVFLVDHLNKTISGKIIRYNNM